MALCCRREVIAMSMSTCFILTVDSALLKQLHVESDIYRSASNFSLILATCILDISFEMILKG